MSDPPIVVPPPAPKNSFLAAAELIVRIVIAVAVSVIAARPDSPAPAPDRPVTVPARPDRKPRPDPPAAPVDEWESLGHSYAIDIAATCAKGWTAAADSIEKEGTPVAEAQRVLADTWRNARIAAFYARVGPTMQKALPEGQEPKDAEDRKRIAAKWRLFAKGLGDPR